MVNLNQSINAYKNYVREERKFHGSMTPKEYGIQIMKRNCRNEKKEKKKWKDKMIWKN